MSDTPKTDAFEALVNRPTNWWDFARELERENAALRAELRSERQSVYNAKQVEIPALLRENAALRAMLQRADDTLDVCRVKSAALIRRDIADVLARKEAQP